MVIFNNGCQLPVFLLWLFYNIFISPEGSSSVLALGRWGSYEAPENFESFSTDLVPPSELPVIKSLESNTQLFEQASPSSISPPTKADKSRGKWFYASDFDNIFLPDFLRQNLLTAVPPPPPDENFTFDVQELVKGQNSLSTFDAKLGSKSGITRKRSSERLDFPLDRLFESPEISASQVQIPTMANPKQHQSPIYMPQRVNKPVKRWWGTYYRPRPQMDRRASQSKHYGCLKRCISIGKLHPIQCHTLC